MKTYVLGQYDVDETARYWTKKILGSADPAAALEQFRAFLQRVPNGIARGLVNSYVTQELLEDKRFTVRFTVE